MPTMHIDPYESLIMVFPVAMLVHTPLKCPGVVMKETSPPVNADGIFSWNISSMQTGTS